MTICDCCGDEIPIEESNPGIGEWEDGTLCNECYADEWMKETD